MPLKCILQNVNHFGQASMFYLWLFFTVILYFSSYYQHLEEKAAGGPRADVWYPRYGLRYQHMYCTCSVTTKILVDIRIGIKKWVHIHSIFHKICINWCLDLNVCVDIAVDISVDLHGSFTYQGSCARSGYQGQAQVITSNRYCWM